MDYHQNGCFVLCYLMGNIGDNRRDSSCYQDPINGCNLHHCTKVTHHLNMSLVCDYKENIFCREWLKILLMLTNKNFLNLHESFIMIDEREREREERGEGS